MSDAQYVQYVNLHIFAKDWRKYKRVSPELNKSTFRKNMQYDRYVRLDYFNTSNGKPVVIYLLAKGSKYAEQSHELKKLLAKIKDPSDVILVSEKKFKVYSMRVIATYKHLRVKMYLHENFALIIPKGPLCSKHELMTTTEVKHLLNNELFCYLYNLPKILVSDPQCIWIGAEVGDVVRITSLSETSGEFIQYKVVVARSGRIISFRGRKKKKSTSVDHVKEPAHEDEDEEIKEFRETVKNNLDDDYGTDDDTDN